MRHRLNKTVLFMAVILFSQTQVHAEEAYEPGVILFKLKDAPAVSSNQAQGDFFVPHKKALAKRSTVRSTKPANSLPLFLKNVKVKSIAKAFPSSSTSNTKATKQAVKTKIPAKDTLANIYRTELHNPGDLKKVLELCGADPAIEYCQPSYLYTSDSFPVDQNTNDPEYYNPNNVTTYSYHNFNNQTWMRSMGKGVLVGVVDSSFLPDHEDLQKNIWLNVGELPCYDWHKDGTTVCVDSNTDGEITLDELKVAGLGDTNSDGIIELKDLFGSIFEDHVDHDGNGKINDFLGWNFYSGTNNNYRQNIASAHGSAVAGIIGAVGDNGKGSLGTAFQSKILTVQSGSDSGLALGRGSAYEANAIKYAADTGAKVINYSRGSGTGNDQVVNDAIAYAIAQGAVFVASAGNRNFDVRNQAPANFDKVIAVGALELNGQKYSSSNYGPGITVWAIGADTTTVLAGTINAYTTAFSQTSAAAPLVAGAVALLMSKNIKDVPDENSPRRIQASEYKGLIQKTCRKNGFVDHGIDICVLDAQALVNVEPPVLNAISAQTGSVGQITRFDLTASEANPNDSVERIKVLRTTLPDGTVLEGQMPEGATLTAVDNAHATFEWTPPLSMADGVYRVTFQADNTMGLKDIQTAVITIEPPTQSGGFANLTISTINIHSTNREDNFIFVNDSLDLSVAVRNAGTAASSQTAMEICLNNTRGVYRPGSPEVINGTAVSGSTYYGSTCTTVTVPELSPNEEYQWSNIYWPINAAAVAGRNYIQINPDVIEASNARNTRQTTVGSPPPSVAYAYMYESWEIPQAAGSVQPVQPVRRGVLIRSTTTSTTNRVFVEEGRASRSQNIVNETEDVPPTPPTLRPHPRPSSIEETASPARTSITTYSIRPQP